ncbi:uncharacterized protein LOC109821396 [Asparagus officinalis]|uniref:uncharacterized protein LOC109821396 n=1 Tax=Asparagus officinalis TaxID=4686 RepID=UPI00098E2379|nr:uncharacterized protein LOC109821396 [Asparagus officinalis]
MKAIEAEVKKLIESGFIREEQHPDWVANIIPVLKKNGKIRDDAFQKAFEEIKQYLSNPPILVAAKLGKPFLICIRTTDHALAGLLAQDDEKGYEQAVYYVSRTLSGAEPRYPLIEKECLALVFTVQKIRYYLVGQTIHVISLINPIRVFMTQPSALNWRLARRALLLSQYDIHFKPQKAVKGQAICELMANHPLKEKAKLYQDIPDETYEANVVSREQVWQLYFDGAARTSSTGRTLYQKSYDGLLLRCLSNREAKEALKEAHDGICGAHQPSPKLWDRLYRLGYYWPIMVQDDVAYAK